LIFLLTSTSFISSSLFFLTATSTTHIYTLSLHDALPISIKVRVPWLHLSEADVTDLNADAKLEHKHGEFAMHSVVQNNPMDLKGDRKSTRLNSSHRTISYAVFCLKKKTKKSNTKQKQYTK